MAAMLPSRDDLYLFNEGSLFQSYKVFGAHVVESGLTSGIRFTVWAPNATAVRVIGNFNDWDGHRHAMERIDSFGVWTLFTTEASVYDLYKYEIHTTQGEVLSKADPFGVYSEIRPNFASVIYPLSGYQWQDEQWQKKHKSYKAHNEPVNIYEVHLGSWRLKDNGEHYTYRDLAVELVDYVVDMGYTHIEILPVMEHPFDGSWGYQITGYYSVTSRYGTPKDFMYFIDQCHQKGIGVILDWVPSHFCKDDHGLRMFDGTPIYEYTDSRKAEKGEWGTLSFDFAKHEVHSFLISNAMFWFEQFHIDGLRVDAVASMLYLDFGKEHGQWTRNEYGGRENIEAIAFLRKLNEAVFKHYPNVLIMAEESTAWPLVSAPTYLGGLGFNYKWNMGWMNDMLKYMELDSVHRKWHHQLLTFSFFYAFSENFILPISHDEVVHGKKSLLNKMPGDYWQKFANLRLFIGYMMTHPGKKLLFMGSEFGQFIEWNEKQALDWFLLDYEMHHKVQLYFKHINHFYKNNSILWELDHHQEGFSWIDPHDFNQSMITFMRLGEEKGSYFIIVCNFTPTYYENYRIGVPELAEYSEVFNSDLEIYGGSGQHNEKQLRAQKTKWHNQPFSLEVKIPPLATIILEPRKKERSV
ncbi:1,4-alpha-glucan branching enzyme [Desulfuribacillus stibiiarsenatis]|uniref:1,4-alpha-glucan branching enzyme GlgB n=1 Tax=Desulfuribacillus stibiiarsenatis TaxID=1390249 RepID=A0A1E5L3H1_9FIRM|nr:1,4-alpha-glucan branching protein GlgB [Desulfuribacillus stibiiarsenatis]OEH84613.1 1,4-alpha-glucan branching enzyme [Desulfuribacillus stibiiarsenatis]